MQSVAMEVDDGDRMLLDVLVRLKALDPSLGSRHSCREGVRGSDAMNVNGNNRLACVTNMRALSRDQAACVQACSGQPDAVLGRIRVHTSRVRGGHAAAQEIPGLGSCPADPGWPTSSRSCAATSRRPRSVQRGIFRLPLRLPDTLPLRTSPVTRRTSLPLAP